MLLDFSTQRNTTHWIVVELKQTIIKELICKEIVQVVSQVFKSLKVEFLFHDTYLQKENKRKDLETEFVCPNCKRKMKIKIKEMVPGRTKKCPSCDLTICFSGDDGRKAQGALDNLQKTLKRLGAK